MKDDKKREKMIIDFKFSCLKFCLILQLALNYNNFIIKTRTLTLEKFVIKIHVYKLFYDYNQKFKVWKLCIFQRK